MKFIEETDKQNNSSDLVKQDNDFSQEDFLNSVKDFKPSLSYVIKNSINSFVKTAKRNLRKIIKSDLDKFKSYVDYLPYKNETLSHHSESISQYVDFYNKENGKNTNLSLYRHLLQFNGIADIPNPYSVYDDKYYKFHPDFLFCDDMENLFNFFLKDKIRQKEIAQHFDLMIQHKEDFDRAEKLGKRIEELKLVLLENKEKLEDYFTFKAENKEKLPDDIFKKYDEHSAKIIQEYEATTVEYNNLLEEIPNQADIVDDYVLFSSALSSANIALLTIAFGDRFLPQTFKLLDLENIQLYYVFAILFSEEKVWKEFDITEQSLIENINKINIQSEKVVLGDNIVLDLLKNRKQNLEHNQEYLYQSITQDFDLDFWSIKLDLNNERNLERDNKDTQKQEIVDFE